MDYRYLNTRGWLNEGVAQGDTANITATGPPPMATTRATAGKRRQVVASSHTLALSDADEAERDVLPEHLAREYRVVAIGRDPDGRMILAIDRDELEILQPLVVDLSHAGVHRPFRFERMPVPLFVEHWRRVYGGPAPAVDTGQTLSMAESAAMREHAPTSATSTTALYQPGRRAGPPGPDGVRGLDRSSVPSGVSDVWFYTVVEGQRVLLRRPNGTMDVVVGPKQLWKGRNTFMPMAHYVAHPGDFLIVRFRDGHQEHLPGPSEVWFDPRIHQEVTTQEGLQLAAKEAVVVYSGKEGTDQVQRRVVHGPALFIPRPGEWLHTFSWHASRGGSKGVVKIPNGLVFQKLWMMPDQMYHDVGDVRTADDAVLTIRLMIFFELVDINTMLDTTHDPIGDFVNAASSDVVDFVGRHDFERFKLHTDQLNELSAYKQLVGRASQCGYRINKVVYRGYGAPEQLQQMHDQAIEARTKLQLARATERQSQELRDSKLENRMTRASKRRGEQEREVEHEVTLKRTRLQAELEASERREVFERQQRKLAAEDARAQAHADDARRREHLAALRDLGVDLTALLTRGHADRIIELRGTGNGANTHLHVEPLVDGSA